MFCDPSECPKGSWIPYYRLVVNPDIPRDSKRDQATMLNVKDLLMNQNFNRYDFRLLVPDPVNYFNENCLQNFSKIFIGMNQVDEIFFPEAANLLLKENQRRQKETPLQPLQIIFYEFKPFSGNFVFWKRHLQRINNNLKFMSANEVEQIKNERA